jgi:transcriptional regulator with XRE-family HTH domain
MKIDYQRLFKIVYKNKENGISIKDTLAQELGYTHSANFYKSISPKQRERLSQLKGLTEKNKTEFKKLYLEGWSAAKLARKYNVRTKTALSFAENCTDDYVRSLKNPNRKLTKYQVIKILISTMRDGVMQKDLAVKYGVSASNISNICCGRHWKHIFQGVKEKYNTEILSILPQQLPSNRQ